MPDGYPSEKYAARVAAGAAEMKVPGRGVADPDSIGPVDPDPDSESGSGSRRAKMTHKSRNFFLKSSCFEVLDDGLF